MDAPFGKMLKITSIDSKTLIAEDKWKMGFLGNAPIGWEVGDRIRLSEATKLGGKPGSTDASTSRVQVENLDKKSAAITMYFEGATTMEKSFKSSELQPSLQKNIRLDREAYIKKILSGNIIIVEDSEGRQTKWQIDMLTASSNRVQWYEGDTVVITKAVTPKRVKIINKDRNQELGAIFISEE